MKKRKYDDNIKYSRTSPPLSFSSHQHDRGASDHTALPQSISFQVQQSFTFHMKEGGRSGGLEIFLKL